MSNQIERDISSIRLPVPYLRQKSGIYRSVILLSLKLQYSCTNRLYREKITSTAYRLQHTYSMRSPRCNSSTNRK